MERGNQRNSCVISLGESFVVIRQVGDLLREIGRLAAKKNDISDGDLLKIRILRAEFEAISNAVLNGATSMKN